MQFQHFPLFQVLPLKSFLDLGLKIADTGTPGLQEHNKKIPAFLTFTDINPAISLILSKSNSNKSRHYS